METLVSNRHTPPTNAAARAAGTGNSEFLLTPGPLTTSLSVKQAMLRDWGSRDKQFIALNKRIRERLVAIAGGGESFVCVPVQGSGTFAVEATLGTLVPRDGRLLVLVNGRLWRAHDEDHEISRPFGDLLVLPGRPDT